MPKIQLVQYRDPQPLVVELVGQKTINEKRPRGEKYDHNANGDSYLRQGEDAPVQFLFPGAVEQRLSTAPEPVRVPMDMWARMKKECRFVQAGLLGDRPIFREVGTEG